MSCLSAAPIRAAAAGLSFVEPLAAPLVFARDANNNGPYGPDSAYGIAKGDFNGDGKLDLAVTASQAAARPAPDQAFIYVMLGNGDGRFQPPGALPIPLLNGSRAQVYGILAKDFDQDTMVDLLTVSPELQEVLFFKGHGDGTFALPVATTTTGRPVAVQAADLDGDDILDVVTLNSFDQTQIEVFIGNGNGTFRAPSQHTVNSGQSDLLIADFNHDDAPDLFVASADTPSAYILLNDGHGGFPEVATALPPLNKQITGVYAAKFDDDDFVDVLVSGIGNGPNCGFGDWLLLKGNGNGTFAAPTPNDCIPRSTTALFANSRLFSENVTPDLNGDGHADVIFVDNGNYLDVGLGDGTGHFTTSRMIASPGAGYDYPGQYVIDSIFLQALVSGDFNGDGVADVAVAGAQCNGCRPGGVSVVLGATPGTFHTPQSYDVPPLTPNGGASPDLRPRSTLLGDFNHDDHPDLIFLQGFSDDRPQMIKGLGDGTLLGPSSGPLGATCYVDLLAADFDKDGNLDFACAGSGINVTWGDGTGAFPAATNLPVDADVQPFSWGANALAVGDINGDTYPDVVWLEYNFFIFSAGRIAVDLYDPTHPRTFTRTLSFDPGRIDGGTEGLAVGDFNGDHHLDIVFHTMLQADGTGGERFMVLLGNGAGGFQAPLITQPGLPHIEQLQTYDFNGDGHTDVLAVGYTGGFYVLLGHGDGQFDPPVDYPNTTYDAKEARIVDFDGDGIADVALASSTSTVALFKGNSDGTFQPPVRFATGRDRTDTIVAGDLNGDDKPDIVAGVFLAGSEHADFTVLINNSPTLPDLIVNSVSVPASGTPGDLITIDYSVQNTAAVFASSTWDDAIYFSTDTTLDGGDTLVGTVHHIYGLTGGAAYQVSAVFPIPAVPPGMYHVIVRTDDGGVVAEGNESNNSTPSIVPLAVQDVPRLVVGTPVSASTQAGQFLYYRYVAQAGSDLRFDADISVPSRIDFYERFGSLPTLIAFDQKYPAPDFHQQVQVSPTAAGTYYVLFHNSSGNAADVTLTVTPTETPTPTPTATVGALVGDCMNRGFVAVDDLLTMVNIALGLKPVTDCEAGDPGHDGMITIDDIIRAVNAALTS